MKIGFFEEAEGVRSMNRLLAFMLTVSAMLAVFIPMLQRLEVDTSLVVTLLGYGIGAKQIGRWLEDHPQ
jgi:hypothetical protein